MSTRFTSWVKNLNRWISRPVKRTVARRATPTLELLEDRAVPATFNVNSLADLSILGGVNPRASAQSGQSG